MSCDERGWSINDNDFLRENQDDESNLCSSIQKIQEQDLHTGLLMHIILHVNWKSVIFTCLTEYIIALANAEFFFLGSGEI
jgi:hypothetical protein